MNTLAEAPAPCVSLCGNTLAIEIVCGGTTAVCLWATRVAGTFTKNHKH